MQFGEAVTTCFRKYVDFNGRAMRSEYWWFYLFTILGSFVFGILDMVFFGGLNSIEPLGTIFSLAVFLPTLSAAARRLHDTNRSGWWQAVPLVPLIFIGAFFGYSIGGSSGFPEGGLAIGMIVLGLVAFVAVIVLIVWLATKGTDGPNRFGDDPFGNTADIFD